MQKKETSFKVQCQARPQRRGIESRQARQLSHGSKNVKVVAHQGRSKVGYNVPVQKRGTGSLENEEAEKRCVSEKRLVQEWDERMTRANPKASLAPHHPSRACIRRTLSSDIARPRVGRRRTHDLGFEWRRVRQCVGRHGGTLDERGEIPRAAHAQTGRGQVSG